MLNFAKEIENMSAVEILNYYWNLYHADSSNTERGIVANAINDALSTIARQRAELEKLKSNYNKLCEYAEKKEFELAEINADISWFREVKFSRLAPAIKEIKVEAYKEFAERLNNAAMSCLIGDKYSYKIITTQGVDNLLKEMVGEDE